MLILIFLHLASYGPSLRRKILYEAAGPHGHDDNAARDHVHVNRLRHVSDPVILTMSISHGQYR